MSLDYSRRRLRAFRAEIKRLQDAEFPYIHSREALDAIDSIARRHLESLDNFGATSDSDIVKQQCTLALETLFLFLPLLGFVLRSTNVRNAFEVHGPLRRLASSVLEQGSPSASHRTKLLLSSEWEYSPFVYRYPDLPDFVLIGLPAFECANPLLLPLAGHELGHVLWTRGSIESSIARMSTTAIINAIKARWLEYSQLFVDENLKPEDLTTSLYAVETWQRAQIWAISQIEETFCDLLGTKLFGTSYLHAFAYIIAPGPAGMRSLDYPNTKRRIENIIAAANQYKFEIPGGYRELFDDAPEQPLRESDQFMLVIAETSVQVIVPRIIDFIDKIVEEAKIHQPTRSETERIYTRFQHVVPAEHAITLADVVNAGWMAFQDEDLWKLIPNIYGQKDTILKELILKNIEVFEIEQIMQEVA